jgi:hypothetical protein
MEKRHDILFYLREHPTPPPPEVAERVLRIPEQPEAASWQRLQEHPVPPPAALNAAIRSGIRFSIRSDVKPYRQNRYRLRFAYSAAAAILLVVAGLVLYRFVAGRPEHDTKTLAGPSRPASSSSPAGVKTDSSTLAAKHPSGPADTSAGQPLPLELGFNGEQYPLTDNSLLATFTSFHYPALKKYLADKRTDNGWHIRLDQYTNISLSRVMVATLRKLYVTRPDGAPAREAKKTRQLLDRWTEQDKKQFDLRYISNPLDPIDLAEFLFPPLFSFGRHTAPAVPPASSVPSADSLQSQKGTQGTNAPLTVSYTLTVVTKRTNAAIGETYNGGLQTLFHDGRQARLRLATLMRIQSIFLHPDIAGFTVLTESVKSQSPITLTTGQWAEYNRKYAGAGCSLADDTTRILGYACRKALIRLPGGQRITAWYTPSIRDSAQALLEPAFAPIPGLVLQYEYTIRRKTIRYTASTLSHHRIDPAVFVIPVQH